MPAQDIKTPKIPVYALPDEVAALKERVDKLEKKGKGKGKKDTKPKDDKDK